MMSRVFVSYARSDQALADNLFQRLRAMPVEVWSDDQLDARENWSDRLRSRLRDSELFLLLLTPKTLESSWVLQELGAAWALKKPIIPVVTDRRLLDKLPFDLATAQTVTLDEIDKLEEVLRRAA